MYHSKWRKHPELGVIQFEVKQEGRIETVEVELALWESILDTLGFEPLDGPPTI